MYLKKFAINAFITSFISPHMNLCYIANLKNEYWPNGPVVLEKISISEKKNPQ